MAVGSGSGGGGQGVKAGRAYVEVGVDDSGLRSGLEKIRKGVLKVGAGIAGGGGLMGVGAAITGPILESFREVVRHFDEIGKAAERMGTTTEAVSDLGYAAEMTGASLESVEKGNKVLQKTLLAASEGSKQAQGALGRFGLTAEDFAGKDAAEQFQLIADGLEGIDEAAKGPALNKLLGRGGSSLLPLLKNSEELRNLLEENGRVGGRVNKEDAENAKQVDQAYRRVQASIVNTFRAIGAALLPQADKIKQFSFAFIDGAKVVKDFIDKNRAAVLSILSVGAAITGAGAILVGIGTALAIASVAVGGLIAGVTALGSVLAVVFSPVGLAVAAALVITVVAIAAALELFPDEISALGDIFGEVFGEIADVFSKTWGGITDALSAGDIKLAFKVGLAGLNVLWQGFLVGVQGGWNAFKGDFVDGWHDLVTEIELLWEDLANALAIAMVQVLADISSRFGETFNSIIDGLKSAAEHLGLDSLASSLGQIQGIAKLNPAELQQEIQRDTDRKKKGIRDDAASAQAERDAARDLDLLAQAAALGAAQLELDAATKEAADAAEQAMFQRMADYERSHYPKERKDEAIAALGNVRSQMGGFGASQALGVSGESIAKKQLDVLNDIRDNTEDLGGIEGW